MLLLLSLLLFQSKVLRNRKREDNSRTTRQVPEKQEDEKRMRNQRETLIIIAFSLCETCMSRESVMTVVLRCNIPIVLACVSQNAFVVLLVLSFESRNLFPDSLSSWFLWKNPTNFLVFLLYTCCVLAVGGKSRVNPDFWSLTIRFFNLFGRRIECKDFCFVDVSVEEGSSKDNFSASGFSAHKWSSNISSQENKIARLFSLFSNCMSVTWNTISNTIVQYHSVDTTVYLILCFQAEKFESLSHPDSEYDSDWLCLSFISNILLFETDFGSRDTLRDTLLDVNDDLFSEQF